MRQLFQLVSIQLKEFYREPGILFWAFVFPIAIAGILGIAFDTAPNQSIQVGFIGSESDLRKLPQENVEWRRVTLEEGMTQVKRGRLHLLVSLDDRGQILFQYDSRNPEATKEYYRLLHAFEEANGNLFSHSVQELKAPGSRYIDFLVPGLLAMGVMNSCMWGVGWALIEMRMKKLLRRMAATPMNKPLFFLSFVTTRICITSLESLLLFGFVYYFFDIRIQGSFLALVLVYLSGIYIFSGIAILIATRARSSQVGNGLVNAVTMPMMVLSGIFFTYQNFPDFVLPIVQYMPLTILADTTRSIFLEGDGLLESSLPISILLAVGTVFHWLGIRFFKWS